MREIKIVAQAGEAGDNVYTWPALKTLGGCHLVNVDRSWNRPNWTHRSIGLKRLAESQDYIHSFTVDQGQPIDLDLSTYRAQGTRHGELIPLRIARWARVKVDIDTPWLSVEPDNRTKGRIILNRAPRWVGSGAMPYAKIVQAFQKELLFVGTDKEYADFCASCGPVERFPCQDLLDVARAIKGSELFIGAQSCPYAICEGLKHPAVLEVCLTAPDVCFIRPDVIHYIGGTLKFSACGKDFEAEAESVLLNKQIPPKGGYRVTIGETTFQDWDFMRLEQTARAACIVQQFSLSIAQIRQKIEEESMMPIPNHLKLAA